MQKNQLIIEYHLVSSNNSAYNIYYSEIQKCCNILNSNISEELTEPSQPICTNADRTAAYSSMIYPENKTCKLDIFLTFTCNPYWPDIVLSYVKLMVSVFGLYPSLCFFKTTILREMAIPPSSGETYCWIHSIELASICGH
jgi:hypothetical protein